MSARIIGRCCDRDGCNRPAIFGRLCAFCWYLLSAFGLADGGYGQTEPPPACSLPDCPEPAWRDGLCAAHAYLAIAQADLAADDADPYLDSTSPEFDRELNRFLGGSEAA